MNFIRITFYSFIIFIISSCGRNELRDPIENDRYAPGEITNVKVENLNGGARISYVIPDDSDLLYIRAHFQIRNGQKEEVKSSYYNNSLEIFGFGDTLSHQVELFSVDRSGNQSEAVTVVVNPLVPPVVLAFETLHYNATFGGIYIECENQARGNLVTTVLIKDDLGNWEEYDKNYSSLPNMQFYSRGLSNEPKMFGVVLEDRWGNHSDTLFKQLTPLFEEELNKNKFKEMHFPDEPENTWPLSGLWDNNISNENNDKGWHSLDNEGVPVWFSFDLGVKAIINRIKTWQVRDGREYSSGNMKQFEVWGSNNPSPDGSFTGWTKLGDGEIKKPSGDGGALTDEDVLTALNGDETLLPPNLPAVRYIRVRIISTFSSPPNSDFGSSWLKEISLWGQEVD